MKAGVYARRAARLGVTKTTVYGGEINREPLFGREGVTAKDVTLDVTAKCFEKSYACTPVTLVTPITYADIGNS